MLTIQRVGKETVVGWDGNHPHHAKLRHVSLGEFNSTSPHPWMLAKEWSTVVGRVYFDDGKSKADVLATRPVGGKDRTKNQMTMVVEEEEEEVVMDPYKVVCVCQVQVEQANGSFQNEIVIRDHAMKLRPLPTNETKSKLPTRRSLSEAMQDRRHAKSERRAVADAAAAAVAAAEAAAAAASMAASLAIKVDGEEINSAGVVEMEKKNRNN